MIFTSEGLNQKSGRKLIRKELAKDDVSDKKIILFTLCKYRFYEVLKNACLEMGFKDENITIYDGEENTKVDDGFYDYIYVTEGDAFDIMEMIKGKGMETFIRRMVKENNATYIGASAGAILAGSDYLLAKEFKGNHSGITECDGFDLFGKPATIIPHYTKEDLARFRVNMEAAQPGVLNRYKGNIMHVRDGRVLVVEI